MYVSYQRISADMVTESCGKVEEFQFLIEQEPCLEIAEVRLTGSMLFLTLGPSTDKAQQSLF